MVTLRIDDETFAFWKEQATARGLSVEEWLKAETARGHRADESPRNSEPQYAPNISQDEWVAELLQFARRHRPTGRPLDDSRESIYD